MPSSLAIAHTAFQSTAIDLYPHNQKAYQSALKCMQETGKAAIIHPTGTGKSFIGFKLCEDNPSASICWLSPSDYIFKTQLENLAATGADVPENISFFTYAKLVNLSIEEIAAIHPDYIILDEFHRCGADVWGAGVNKLISHSPNVPVLGLSATNIRYLDNQRDMAEELFDGNIASEMTLGETIVRGILPAPKYVISIYSYQEKLEKYQKRIRKAKSHAARDEAQKYLDALRRTLTKAAGLDEVFAKHIENKAGKYIAFCANIEHLNSLIACVPQWFSRVDSKPHVYKVYSDDPETSNAFREFKDDKSDHLKLLFCIDMLNEGIHVEDISGVILFRPTISPIIYKQQIGRALSASKSQVPIIFDVVNNFENLYSIGTIEQEMQFALSAYRELGQSSFIVNERFSITDEVRGCKELFDALNDTLSASWDLMFEQAKVYYQAHGDLDVPKLYKTPNGYSLGTWISVQRRVKEGIQYGNLSVERIALLNSIGMIWENRLDIAWNRYFTAASDYYAQYGNLNVLANYTTDAGLKLGQWLRNLRQEQASGRQTRLTPERVAQLESIGMIWDKFSFLWEQNYLACANYYIQHGNLDIPISYTTQDGLRIGVWVQKLRSIRNGTMPLASPLTKDEISRLDAIGMVWGNKAEQLWDEGYKHALSYHAEFGNLDVPASYICEDGYKLGAWLSRHLSTCKGSSGIKVTPERKEKLSALGMKWESRDSWEIRYELAQKYFKEYGNLNVAGDYVVGGVWLGKWLNEQKQIYLGKRKTKSLTAKQIAQLESIGMEWKSKSELAWQSRYEAVRSYAHEYNTLQIPRDVLLSDGKTIGNWLVIQRTRRKEGKLNAEQIKKLDELGFVWEQETSWEVGYAHAKQYYQQNKNLSVARDYICQDGYALGNWLSNQKSIYNKPSQYNSLTPTQIKQLEAIGIIWKQTEVQWDSSYQYAYAFYHEHGHLNVPTTYKTKDGFYLHTWLATQIKKQRSGKLSSEQISKLNDLNFDWLFPVERSWENAFSYAEQYFQNNKNLDISTTYRTTSGFTLGAWIKRMKKQKDQLSLDQKTRLTSVGMVWE